MRCIFRGSYLSLSSFLSQTHTIQSRFIVLSMVLPSITEGAVLWALMIESHKGPEEWNERKNTVKRWHIYMYVYMSAFISMRTHTQGEEERESVSNYRQMYSLILLLHFVIEGCDLRQLFFLPVVLIVYGGLIKDRLSLRMITALSTCWHTSAQAGGKQRRLAEWEGNKDSGHCLKDHLRFFFCFFVF